MKIVMLEENAVSNNDIIFDKFHKLGEFVSYGNTMPSEILERISDADVVLCNKCQITAEVLNSCNNLKYIGECATGYNNIDLEAASKLGITVTNAGEYSTMAVAQHVFALILQLLSKIYEYDISVHNGDWINSKAFIYYLSPTTELSGLTMGIFGFGSIGKAVAKIANAFGMKVLVSTRTVPKNSEYPYDFVSKEMLFKMSDIVSLHCPLTEATAGIVNFETLLTMKESSYIINTSRGGVIIEEALAKALNENVIAGAGLDVISTEPMLAENPLFTAKNCVITPHIAWAPLQTRERLMEIVINNLESYLSGNPKNVVNIK